VFRPDGRGARHRRETAASPQPLCGVQGRGLLAGGYLSGGLWHVCLHRHPGQPRITVAPEAFCDPEDIEGVRAIKAGRATKIQLGNLAIWRDWGWAADYVQAMHRMLQAEAPGDYLIVSGTTTSLQQFAQAAFAVAGLDLAKQVESVEALKLPADLAYLAMNPCRIQVELGWTSKRPIREIVEKMYRDEFF